ncbi:hypothetical protein AAMO2058_001090900 [Amorphochlora amoebiformis]
MRAVFVGLAVVLALAKQVEREDGAMLLGRKVKARASATANLHPHTRLIKRQKKFSAEKSSKHGSQDKTRGSQDKTRGSQDKTRGSQDKTRVTYLLIKGTKDFTKAYQETETASQPAKLLELVDEAFYEFNKSIFTAVAKDVSTNPPNSESDFPKEYLPTAYLAKLRKGYKENGTDIKKVISKWIAHEKGANDSWNLNEAFGEACHSRVYKTYLDAAKAAYGWFSSRVDMDIAKGRASQVISSPRIAALLKTCRAKSIGIIGIPIDLSSKWLPSMWLAKNINIDPGYKLFMENMATMLTLSFVKRGFETATSWLTSFIWNQTSDGPGYDSLVWGNDPSTYRQLTIQRPRGAIISKEKASEEETHPAVVWARMHDVGMWARHSGTTKALMQYVNASAKCNSTENAAVAWGIFAFWRIFYDHTRCQPYHTLHEVMDVAEHYIDVNEFYYDPLDPYSCNKAQFPEIVEGRYQC